MTNYKEVLRKVGEVNERIASIEAEIASEKIYLHELQEGKHYEDKDEQFRNWVIGLSVGIIVDLQDEIEEIKKSL